MSPSPQFPEKRLSVLIADAAARLVTIDCDEVEAVIVDCLRLAVEDLQLDRAYVWLMAADRSVVRQLPVVSALPITDATGSSVSDRVPVEMRAGDTVSFRTLDEAPAGVDREGCVRSGLCSAVITCFGAAHGADGDGLIIAVGCSTEQAWLPEIVEPIRTLAAVIGQALARCATAGQLREARAEIARLYLEAGLGMPASPQIGSGDVHRPEGSEAAADSLVGRSKTLQRVLDQIQQVAPTDSTVLLLGETGVGKEVLATRLHELSARRKRAMVRVNCAAIPSTLIESELFGREKGAFTGAVSRQLGRFEFADKSTIFLDEIGDLPLEVQVKLLRVLEDGQIERLGSSHAINVDVRIVAATHRNLEERLTEGSFRDDLFYRLNVFPVRVPPLRERVEDIPLLVWRFVDEFSLAFRKPIDAIARADMDALQRHSWPGNIRELRNVVERAMIVATGPRLAIPLASPVTAGRSLKLVDVERDHLRSVLESTGWRVRGSGGAADLLGLQPATLEARMARLDLRRPGA